MAISGKQKARTVGATVGASIVRGVLGTMIKRPVDPVAGNRTPAPAPAPKTAVLMFLALIVAAVLGGLALAGAFSGPKTAPVPSAPISLTDATVLDQRYDIEANSACEEGADDYLRSLSRYEFKWDDVGFLGHKFDKYLTVVQWPGVLTMKSERALQQNEFGAFQRVTIWCNYDTQSGKVLSYK
jgi:hypothetical protein